VATARDAQHAFERTPPQNILAERAVLGAMLVNPEAVATALEILREDPSDLFYADAHQHVFAAMVTLFGNQIKVDEITVGEQLVRDGRLDAAGGYSYLSELIGAAPLSSSADHYARIVLENAVLRKLITSCSHIAEEAYAHQGDVDELLDRVESTIFRIAERRQINEVTSVSDLLEDAIHRIEELIRSHSGITGLATGFFKLDELLAGFQKSDVIILAARPSVGKTALALNLAAHAAVQLKKVAMIFSLEMSKEQLMQRLICMEGQIDSRRLRTGFLADQEFSKVTQAAAKLSHAQIYIDDTPNITILEIRSKARRHAAQHDLDLIVIDYLQLMASSRRVENRQVEIAEISRGIKGIARELGVPVLALSQLSREAEKDETGIPKLSHLRESGAIEQDADVVLMLWRPSDKDESHESIVNVTIAKQRNGPTGNVELFFDRKIQRFKNPVDTSPGSGANAVVGARAAQRPAANEPVPEPTDFEPEFEESPPEDGDVPF